jgi:hypothetical protein
MFDLDSGTIKLTSKGSVQENIPGLLSGSKETDIHCVKSQLESPAVKYAHTAGTAGKEKASIQSEYLRLLAVHRV